MTTWYLLPGMGASSEMYDSIRQKLSFDAHFVTWPKYRNEISFKEVAERLISENRIEQMDIIGGSSLGGMIALEIAMILNSKAVVLIGSALHRNEIMKLISALSPLASITPFSFMQALAGRIDHIVTQMFSQADPEFIRSMCRYVSSWPGYQGPTEKVFRLHGENDHVIPCPKAGSEVIRTAGHLLAITHPEDCSAFLDRINTHLTATFT